MGRIAGNRIISSRIKKLFILFVATGTVLCLTVWLFLALVELIRSGERVSAVVGAGHGIRQEPFLRQALVVSGITADSVDIERAKQFLTDSQQPHGNRLVPADRMRTGKRSDALDERSSCRGTAWATIGLLHTLPRAPGPIN